MAKTVQELVEGSVSTLVDEAAVGELRADLEHSLGVELDGWARPPGPLRITKDRLRRGVACPAQLAGGGHARMNKHFALGRVVDAAASALAVAPDTPHESGSNDHSVIGTWRHAIAAPLRAEDSELAEWYSALDPARQLEHDALVDARCDELKASIGDLRQFTVVSQNSTVVEFRAEVALSARPDLVVLGTGRVVVEIKSGKGFGLTDELGFYALVDAMSAGVAPVAVAGVSLVPSATVHSLSVDMDLLQRTMKRVVDTARWCREVDEAVAARRWPRTSAGPQCVFCDLAERCPEIPDEYLEEARQRDNRDTDSDLETAEEEPW